jgi:hypothetical protein
MLGQLGVMVDDENFVRGDVDVELDPVGPQRLGGAKGRDRVLARQLRRSPVGEDFGQECSSALVLVALRCPDRSISGVRPLL